VKFQPNDPPRTFNPTPEIHLQDCGVLALDFDEQITLTLGDGFENDVTCKTWGAYLTNSINVNLRERGLRVALTLSLLGGTHKTFVCLVREESTGEFLDYLDANDTVLIAWLDEIAPHPRG
jgi:hypothetical protein